MCKEPFECLYISNRWVNARLFLLSSVPFGLILKSSPREVRDLFCKQYVGYFKLADQNMFCLNQKEEFRLELILRVPVSGRTEFSSPRSLIVHGWPRALHPLRLIKTLLRVLCIYRVKVGISIYSPFSFIGSTIVLERAERIDNDLSNYLKYDLIIFRVRRLLDSEIEFLRELSDLSNERRPATLCYLVYSFPQTELFEFIDALYDLDCNSEQQYEHLLSVLIRSKHRKQLAGPAPDKT